MREVGRGQIGQAHGLQAWMCSIQARIWARFKPDMGKKIRWVTASMLRSQMTTALNIRQELKQFWAFGRENAWTSATNI